MQCNFAIFLSQKGLVIQKKAVPLRDKNFRSMDNNQKATVSHDSDFEHLRVWNNNTNLDYYLSEEHWNFHVNQMLHKNLLVFHEGKEVGAFLDDSKPDFGAPIKDFSPLYGNMFNEVYRLCNSILTTPVPETKVAQFANQSATWKFRNLKDDNGKPLNVAPNVTDLIESYHILGMVNAILSFANDKSAYVDRFMIALSVYKDKGLPFCGFIHCFEPYNKIYQKFIFTTVVDGSYLRPGFDYKKRDEYLRKNLPWYNNIAKLYETNSQRGQEKPSRFGTKNANIAESVIDKISANNIRYYYEGWRNGKHGSICQTNGIYRFVEMTYGKSGILDDVNRNEEDNPIVAKGIVAYWLQFNSRMDTVIKQLTKYNCKIPRDIREQFDIYTRIRFEQFRQEHRDDPETWDWDWNREFYANVIIPHEMAFNKLSEALFDYISDSDIVLVRGVMNNYIKYLKKIRTEKGYQVKPELLVLRAIESGDETKQEDLEEFEVNTILDKLEEKGYIKVAWIEGHKPEGVRLLDKGRVYLKQLEEGSVAVETKTIVTPQKPLKGETEIPNVPQTTKDSEQEDNKEIEWNNEYDYIFDERVKPQEIKRAIETVKSEKVKDRRFHYVAYRILKVIKWIPIEVSESEYMRWINCHFKCGWEKNKNQKKAFLFNLEGTVKDLDDLHPSEWKDDSLYGKLGKHYRLLAISFKNVFTMTIVNGKPDGESESYEHLKDRVEFLSGARDVYGTLWAPDEAYINDGK